MLSVLRYLIANAPGLTQAVAYAHGYAAVSHLLDKVPPPYDKDLSVGLDLQGTANTFEPEPRNDRELISGGVSVPQLSGPRLRNVGII